jgi:hypothetical protein
MKNPHGLTLATMPAAKANPSGSKPATLATAASVLSRTLSSKMNNPATRATGIRNEAIAASRSPFADPAFTGADAPVSEVITSFILILLNINSETNFT